MQITIVYQTTLPTVKDLNFSAKNQICTFSLYKPENHAYLKRAENHNKTKKNHAYNESRKSRLFKKHRKSGLKNQKIWAYKNKCASLPRPFGPRSLHFSTILDFLDIFRDLYFLWNYCRTSVNAWQQLFRLLFLPFAFGMRCSTLLL